MIGDGIRVTIEGNPMRRAGLWISIVAGAAVGANAFAQVSYPMVTHVVPSVVERGKTMEVTVHGRQNFAGASQAFVQGSGVTATVVPPEKPAQQASSVKLKVTVAAEAALGAREIRIATSQGPSSVAPLIVADLPVLAESGNHATRETAQAVAVGNVVSGIISGREQIDMYKFAAQAGQQVTLEICSSRLMHKVHDLQNHFDPILTLYDASGRELASNDDYHFADSMLTHKFEKDGEYFVSVRDVRFDGDGRWTYALFVTDRPYVTAIHPMAVESTGSRKVSAVGFGLPAPAFEVPLPDKAPAGPVVVQLGPKKKCSNPVVVEVTDLPVRLESEPNNEAKSATPGALPAALCGKIDKPGDVDLYALALKKGDALRIEVKARRNGSALDSHLRLLTNDGKQLAASDDYKRTKDSLLTAAIGADGTYLLEVRDLLNRGGDTFGYIAEVRRDVPDFELVCDDDKAEIGPGVAKPWFVKASRTGGFNGPIAVRVEGLPAGVTVNPLVIGPAMSQGCLVLTGSKDAKPAAALVRVVGKAEVPGPDGKPRAIERQAQPVSEIYLPGGGRGVLDVDTQIVQVCPNYDVEAVTVRPEKLRLKPGAQVTLEVEVRRQKRYTGRVTLDVRLRHLGGVHGDPLPPGVSLVEGASKTSLGPNDSKGTIVLKADANAKPIEDVPICVMAHVSINFVVKRAYASQPIWVSIGAPPATVAGK